jgi:hypothetical protein
MSLSAKMINGLVVISALLIFSCKKKDEIGLNLQPQDNPLGVNFTDTITLNTYAVLKNDSIRTSQVGYLFAGAYADPDMDFGNVTAEGFVQMAIVNETQNVSGFTADSVVINLNYDFHYGDTTEFQTLEVRKITDDIYKDTIYYSSDPAPATDPTRIDKDTSYKIQPYTKNQKFYLTNAFGTDVLSFVGTGVTNTAFQTQFKGIAITPKDPDQGAVLTVDIAGSDSKILIYYDGGKSYELRLTSAGAEFSRVVGDRSMTPVLAGLVNSGDEVNANGDAYLQSGIGIRTKILFPYLSQLKTLSPNIVVNRAELIFEVDKTTTNPLKAVPIVELLKLNSNGSVKQYKTTSGVLQDVLVQREGVDVLGHDYPLVVGFDSTSSVYTLNVSPYFHALLNGVEENNGIMLASHTAVSSSTVNKTIAGSGSKKVKLKIYYTLID